MWVYIILFNISMFHLIFSDFVSYIPILYVMNVLYLELEDSLLVTY